MFTSSCETMKEFGCLKTSVKEQTISMYEIRDNKITKKLEWPFYKTATEIKCVTDSSFYVKDIDNHSWKYELRVAK